MKLVGCLGLQVFIQDLVKGVRGFMDPAAIEAAIRPKDIHCGETTLLCVENTH